MFRTLVGFCAGDTKVDCINDLIIFGKASKVGYNKIQLHETSNSEFGLKFNV